MLSSISINGRKVSPGQPTYIIAEMSANHGRDYKQAVRLLRAAKEAGADAVKVQTYTPDTMTIDCGRKHFRIGKGTIWNGRRLYELYQEASMPWEWQPRLKKIADDLGIDFFSTPFDRTSVDFLEEMNVPAYKIASFELVDIPLIQYVAEMGRPVILSTGMATLAEIDEAVRAAREKGANEIALLKCSSAYPAPADEMNLKTIQHMAEAFRMPVGLSDHSLGIAVPVTAVALGACVIEKHFTLNRSVPGPDSQFSLEPDEFKAMVEAVRTAEKATGEVSYAVTRLEAASRVFRRSLFVVKDVRAGELFTEDNVRSIRPGYGLHPRHYESILGKTAKRSIKAGMPLKEKLF